VEAGELNAFQEALSDTRGAGQRRTAPHSDGAGLHACTMGANPAGSWEKRFSELHRLLSMLMRPKTEASVGLLC
jgi:hypothetical protein